MILNLNSDKRDVGPGSFKLDLFLISTGAMDNTIKRSIYEANLYSTGIKEIKDSYKERNKEAEPILTRLSKIKENRENNLFKN